MYEMLIGKIICGFGFGKKSTKSTKDKCSYLTWAGKKLCFSQRMKCQFNLLVIVEHIRPLDLGIQVNSRSDMFVYCI